LSPTGAQWDSPGQRPGYQAPSAIRSPERAKLSESLSPDRSGIPPFQGSGGVWVVPTTQGVASLCPGLSPGCRPLARLACQEGSISRRRVAEGTAPGLRAPTGHYGIAQGNALGIGRPARSQALKGRNSPSAFARRAAEAPPRVRVAAHTLRVEVRAATGTTTTEPTGAERLAR
jgi:hypothetical protein